MTLQDLGSLGELIAAIATVATLVYLAIQIRLNTRATREAATKSLILANSIATMDMVKDKELAETLLRGIHGTEELSRLEQLRYNGYFFAYYNQVDYAYDMYRKGNLDEHSWQRIASEIPAYIGCPGGQKWWATDKVRFSLEFVSYVERVVAEQGAPDVIPSVPPSA